MTAPTSLALLIPLAVPQATDGCDWPRWRGPQGTGVSQETGWSAVGAEQPSWRFELGYGHSSFAVVDGRVFTLGHDRGRGRDVLFCLDVASGRELWRHERPAALWNEGHDGGTCTTPAVVDDVVYTSDREGRVFALEAASGRVLWRRDLVEELDVVPPQYGFAASPLPMGDLLVLNVGRLVALDRTNGETRWLGAEHYGNAYSTPSTFEHLGTPALLVLNGRGLGVVERTSGAELAFHAFGTNPRHASPGATPIDVEGWIYVSGQHGGGGALLEPGESGLEVVWQSRHMRTTHSGCVRLGDYLYGFDQSVLKCIDLEGEERWRQRGIGLGALSIAGERLIVVGARGELVVAEASPDGYRELSRRRVLEGGAYWSTPVLSHGRIYVRNSLGHMVCLDHRGTGGAAQAPRELPATSPPAAELLARHVEACGGREALGALRSLRFVGSGEQHLGGPIDRSAAEMLWTREGAFRLRFDSGFEFGITPERGWSVNQHGASVLPQELMDDMLEAIHWGRLLEEDWGFATLESLEPRVFDDRHCHVVRATRRDGARRTLYFDSESGLLAAQEGEGIPLWSFRDYRRVERVTLPGIVSFFWPGSGAMTRAVFERFALDDVEPEELAPPEIIARQQRTAEQKAEDDHRLRGRYGYLVGNYRIATGNMTGTPIHVRIAEGDLRYSFGDANLKVLTEPNAEDHLYDWVNRDLSFQIDRDDAGAMTRLRFFVQGTESGVLEREGR